MNQITRLIIWLYVLMVHLYPSSFRDAFGDEMTAVFAEVITKAVERGGLSLTAVCLRECRDLPLSLVREQWYSLTNREVLMPTTLKKPKWTFYPSWIVLTALSIPVAWGITWFVVVQVTQVVGDRVMINGRSRITEDWLAGYVLIPALGLTMGLLQTLLLRRYLSRIGWWLGATALSWPLAAASISILNIFLPENLDTNVNWFVFLMIILVGGLIGFLQWLVLRRHVRQAGWWIPANIVGWIAVRLIAGENLAGPLDIMLIAILPACVTAATFVWLMNQTQPTEPQEV